MNTFPQIEQKPCVKPSLHTSGRGSALSAYELFVINGKEKREKNETYRGDLTKLYYKHKCNLDFETEIKALIFKLNNLKGWVQAFIYDNTGVERRFVLLHINNGIIEKDLINFSK